MYDQLENIASAIDRVSEITGRLLAWLVLVVVALTFAIVILRYGFDIGSVALQEGVMFLHALIFMLGVGYTLKHEEHVRVDIVYAKLSAKGRAFIDLLGTLLLMLPVCLFIAYISLDYINASWQVREGSRNVGGLDGVYLLKTVIWFMAFSLSLQGISKVIRSWLVLAGHSVTHTPHESATH